MPQRTGPLCAALAVLALFGLPLSAQQDDERWLRHCQSNDDRMDNDKQRFCEVRHLGFVSHGGSITIDPEVNGAVEVVGWDRDSVSVSARIQAGAQTQSDAQGLARDVKVQAGGTDVKVSGPSSSRREHWNVALVVMVPRKSGLNVETVNGPLSVSEVTGDMDLQAQNGPVSLSRLGGDVRARVQNGPLDVILDGQAWNGTRLDAETQNGPLTLAIPEQYNAELETGTVNGPSSITIPLTVTIKGSIRDRIHATLGKGGPPVRVVTTNGPLTIRRAR